MIVPATSMASKFVSRWFRTLALATTVAGFFLAFERSLAIRARCFLYENHWSSSMTMHFSVSSSITATG
ncbi:hypothetical protein MT325_m110L [Paramecium bursaria chlorella virus MT325]|uniref:Uncharacterized protein m110L n=1 Tax=Paramecium bursaria Chlorella virus MT325 TaxID=346932 RepID=A7ITJ0_PBCVM|nr:hypothetical protein MT325_m110L [Paramecium bursaria chlorella virus MT325]